MGLTTEATKRLERDELCGKSLGDYEIVRRIGGGATSDVFLARQKSLGRNVALKILRDELAADETFVKRFLNEARSAAKLEHPNIVRIYEAGELVDSGGGWRRFGGMKSTKTYRYIAQEYIAGLSLAQFLRRRGSASIRQTFSVLEQIALALNRASEFRLVHRDVKPENILLDVDGSVHVVDFGLARPVESEDTASLTTAMTRTGVTLGTPMYMSPEQARGQRLDARSDVYSLGVTAYHMLVGEPPFRGDAPLAVVLKHLNDKPEPILSRRPETPVLLAKLVEQMLSKRPEDRPESAASLLVALSNARYEYESTQGKQRLTESSAVPVSTQIVDSSICETCDSETGVSTPLRTLIDDCQFERPSWDSGKVGGFFETTFEREDFERAIGAATRSFEWTTNCDRLAATQLRIGANQTARQRVGFIVSLLLGFLFGGVALYLHTKHHGIIPPEPPLTIQRFNCVEEQYVFALQTNTIEAWKSVIEYFPDEPYWRTRAERQLALAYVAEDEVDLAEEMFNELGSVPTHGVEVDTIPLAGIGWVAAKRGDYASASAATSQLQFYYPLNRMTEYLAQKTRESLQARRVPEVSPFVFGGNSGQGIMRGSGFGNFGIGTGGVRGGSLGQGGSRNDGYGSAGVGTGNVRGGYLGQGSRVGQGGGRGFGGGQGDERRRNETDPEENHRGSRYERAYGGSV